MNKLLVNLILLIFIQINLIESSDLKIECNLVKNNDVKDSIICNLNTKNNSNKYKYKFINNINNTVSYSLPFEIDSKTSNLVWLNKHQPQTIRWSEVCPSNYLVSTYQQTINLCQNPTCDTTGICTIMYQQINEVTNKSSTLTINLKDNINFDINDNKPMFSVDSRFINITFDLENLDESSNNEIVLIESTEKLDPYRSKINRMRNEFEFDLINFDENMENENEQDEFSASSLYKKYCKSTLSNKLDPFSIRNDIDSEKLFIKYRFNRNDFKLNQQHSCFLYRLSIKRPHQPTTSLSSSIVMVNLFDNRFDKPVFDFQVYNFTVDENSPLNTLIGKVNAIYLNRDDPSASNQIKYKIVPFEANFDIDQILDSDESLLNNRLQIKIDSKTGILSQKSNIDREKNVITGIMDYEKSSPTLVNYMSKSKVSNKQSAEMGLIRFNIEASYESMTYGYSKVNIFIRDVNDNPPVAKIRPLASYVRSNLNKLSLPQSSSNEITNLYVSENTAANQILAYVGVNDPDAGENGTIKSIDLTLINYRKPSNQTLKQREIKYEQLKKFHQSITHLKNRNDFGYEKITCILQQYAKQSKMTSFQFQQQQQPQIPFKLNKINDKLYTIQLTSKLDFKNFESYSVEMRIQDNGTRPQLESKTRINLNVLDQNDNYPIFINSQNKIKIVENRYDIDALVNEDIEKYEWPVIFKANAIDLDDDYNGLIKYSLLNNPFLVENFTTAEEAKILLESTFSLNKDTGELKLLRSINSDNLNKNQMDLIIMAIDQSDTQKLNKTIKITIEIIDTNNNQPVFDAEKYSYKFNFDQSGFSDKQQEWSNYKQIASSIYLTDSDSFEVNSKEFVAENIAKASSLIKTAFLNDIMSESTQNIKPKFLYNDEKCFKTFNFNLIDVSLNNNMINSFIFFVESDEKTNRLYSNKVTCKMSIWLDMNKFKLSYFNSTNKISINFDLLVEDFGLKNETNRDKAGYSSSKANFNIELNNNGFENDEIIFEKVFNKTNDNKYFIDKNEIDLFESQKSHKENNDYIVISEFEIQKACELKSVNKLDRYLNDSTKLEKIDYMNNIKLIKSSNELNKYKIVFKRSEKPLINKKILGVYLLDLYIISNMNVRTLKKIELILYNNNKRNQTYISGTTMLNEYNKELDSFLMNENQLVSKQNSENSIIDSSLIQFQNLLFGTSNTNSQDAAASFFFSQNSLLNGLFLNNRSTFIQIIIISLIISVIILATLICCIILLIKRNCSKSSQNHHKKGNKKSCNKSSTKTINVIDDESITTATSETKKFDELNNSNEEENGGFITRIIKMDECNDKKILRLGLDNSKEKVNRYLDGLNGYEKQQVIIVSAEQNPSSSSSSSSPTSSSSIVDSKKNLIIPVDMYDNKKSSFKYNSNNNNCNVNKNDKLSTTSSSCISDEGCYGSSDFSTESNNNKLVTNKNLKSILINNNTQSPVVSLPQSMRQQKNYCINNLTRFEKIYNNKNDLDLTMNENKITSSTFKSTNKISTVNSPAISSNLNQNNNVQVITSISGSYV